MVTLAHMGRIGQGVCRIDTNCGPVEARLNANGSVTIRNVPSYPQFRRRARWTCRVSAAFTAISPGAATGFS